MTTGAPGTTEAFLDRLAYEGYAVGVRERLAAYTLLTQLAAAGELPESPRDQLLLLQPLLSKNEQEQEKFAGIVADFVPAAGGPPRPTSAAFGGAGRGARSRFARALGGYAPLVAGAVLLLALAGGYLVVRGRPGGPKAQASAPVPGPA